MSAAEERVLLLGDIHANAAALKAVLDDYPDPQPTIWFLGDLFGRGPQPALAYRRLMLEQPEALIIGNHEGAIVGHYQNINIGGLVSGAYNAADWQVLMAHRAELCAKGLLRCDNGAPVGGEVYDFINGLPIVCAPRPTVVMVHGGLERPFVPPATPAALYERLVWDYVTDRNTAEHTLAAMTWLTVERPDDPRLDLPPGPPVPPELILVGHWHARLLYDQTSGEFHHPPRLNQPYPLGHGPVLLSPGSVGFPRENGDRDASYAVLTLRDARPTAVEFRTVAYDRRGVRVEMARKRYPEATIKRLRLDGETETVGTDRVEVL